MNIEVFYEIAQYVGRYECGKRRSEVEVLNPQSQEGQEDADSLLFVPGQYEC